jgi:hypothetical protein
MSEPEAQAAGRRPPGGPGPPAPPGTGEPRSQPDPRDPGPPIEVRLDDVLLGDLGNPRVDAKMLNALLLRGGRVGSWLEQRGIHTADVEKDFPAPTGEHPTAGDDAAGARSLILVPRSNSGTSRAEARRSSLQ